MGWTLHMIMCVLLCYPVSIRIYYQQGVLFLVVHLILLKGFGVTWARTLGLMTSYFIFVDSGRRHFPDQFSRPLLGPFLTSGLSATLGWWIVWPLEYMKAQVQGNYGE